MKPASCRGSGSVPCSDALARRARLRKASLVSGCAVALAWLGPSWHLPTPLVLLGAAILCAFGAAQLLLRDAPGVLPRSSALLLIPLAALVAAGPFASLRSPPDQLVLVEVFLPPGRTREEARSVRPPSEPDRGHPNGSSLAESVVLVVWDLSRDLARSRLGGLARLGAPLSEEDARRIEETVIFVNGAMLSVLESLDEAVERERAKDGVEVPVRSRAAGERGSLELEVDAPAGASFRVLHLVPEPLDGSEAPWRKVVEIVEPTPSGGKLVVPPCPGDLEGLRRILVVEVDDAIGGVHPLPHSR